MTNLVANLFTMRTAHVAAPPVPVSSPKADEVSATVPNWSREQGLRWWDPGARLMGTIRAWQHWHGRWGVVGWALAKWYVIQHRFWSVVSGADIPLKTEIAGGLKLNHPNGIVIHACSKIGPNCLILQQVTLGEGGKFPGFPVIGGHVDIGAGAKILGGVKIGNHARIGANAVVLTDVPEGCTAVGVPARIIKPRPKGVF